MSMFLFILRYFVIFLWFLLWPLDYKLLKFVIHFSLKKDCIYFYLRGSQTGRQMNGRAPVFCCSPQRPVPVALGQVLGRSQDLSEGLPCGWQGRKSLDHLQLPSQVHWQWAGSEMEQLGFKAAPQWGMLVPTGGDNHLRTSYTAPLVWKFSLPWTPFPLTHLL